MVFGCFRLEPRDTRGLLVQQRAGLPFCDSGQQQSDGPELRHRLPRRPRPSGLRTGAPCESAPPGRQNPAPLGLPAEPVRQVPPPKMIWGAVSTGITESSESTAFFCAWVRIKKLYGLYNLYNLLCLSGRAGETGAPAKDPTGAQ